MTDNLLLKGFVFIYNNLEYFEISYSLLFSTIIVSTIFTLYKQKFSTENQILKILKK